MWKTTVRELFPAKTDHNLWWGQSQHRGQATYLPGSKRLRQAPFVFPPWAGSMGRPLSPEPPAAVAKWLLQRESALLELLTSENWNHLNQSHVSQASPWPSRCGTNIHIRDFLATGPAAELQVWALGHSEHISGEEFFNILHFFQPERCLYTRRFFIPPFECFSLSLQKLQLSYLSLLEIESPTISFSADPLAFLNMAACVYVYIK